MRSHLGKRCRHLDALSAWYRWYSTWHKWTLDADVEQSGGDVCPTGTSAFIRTNALVRPKAGPQQGRCAVLRSAAGQAELRQELDSSKLTGSAQAVLEPCLDPLFHMDCM